MFKKNQDLCDVVSILAHCPEDGTFFVLQDNTQEYWLHSTKVVTNKSWKGAAKQLLDEVKLTGKATKLCNITKVWKPFSKESIHHVVFLVSVLRNAKQHYMPPPGKKAVWMSPNELQTNYYKLRSPELLNILSCVTETNLFHQKQSSPSVKIGSQPSWTTLIGEDPMSELSEILQSHMLSDDATHRKIMDCVSYTESIQSSVYSQFLVSCFPATFMNSRIFGSLFAEKFQWNKSDLPRLFDTADVDATGFLSLKDFLYIVAITDPNMKHGLSEVRSRYIFRYYDVNKDKQLDINEVKAIYQDIKSSQKKNADTALLTKDADSCAKALGVEMRQPTDVDKFVKTLASPRLKGTGVLLRSARPATLVLPGPPRPSSPGNLQRTSQSPALSITAGSAQGAMRKGSTEYGVAVHCVRLKKDGTVIDKIWNVEGAMSTSSVAVSKTHPTTSASLETFNQNNVHFEVLRGLEYFEKEVTAKEAALKPGKKAKPAYTWGRVDPMGFARCVIRVCEAVAPLLRTEPRLLDLASPTYVLGDMHGNFVDLMRFEKALWPLGPALSPSTLLVLGDYVDRGPHSIELIAYLFAYKLQCPRKVMLLRGNHEIRAVQKLFTFYKECCHKFGDNLGSEVWEAVNMAMDCLPLAAVIDGKVFCAHGGIPPPWLCPTAAAINTITCPLPRPDEQSPLAWDLMWNDPVAAGEVPPKVQLELNANEGFAGNTRRGTGHVFSADALAAFLRLNSFSVLLRAHQMQERGFYVQMHGRLETVFSASHYGKANNEAACVLVDCGRLRAFRVDLPDE